MKLFLVFLLILAGTVLIRWQNTRHSELDYAAEMREAAALAQEWFHIVKRIKQERHIVSDTYSNVPNRFIIGNDWSDITTSLGSLEAKEISSNPDFAALVVRWLHEAGIASGDTVGLVLSGSFPGISISVLAAIQTMDVDAVILSSLGASTYGANQPRATWLDIEGWLRKHGKLRYRSTLVSMGADSDNGHDLSEEGKIAMRLAADRNHTDLFIPGSLQESILYKTQLLTDGHISLLINVGGNMAALGSCAHALTIPNGLNHSMNTCSDPDRGIISRISENGIPFIQFLYLKELAITYGMDAAPGAHYTESTNLYTSNTNGKLFHILVLLCCLIPVAFLKKKL